MLNGLLAKIVMRAGEFGQLFTILCCVGVFTPFGYVAVDAISEHNSFVQGRMSRLRLS